MLHQRPTVGKADAPAKLDIYEDFMCPACSQFEQTYGDEILDLVNDGPVTIVLDVPPSQPAG